jgi:hypothetical protein
MDWRRAKNILLAILILLNLFLFVNVLSVKDPFNFTGKYQKDAKKALQAAGVIITCNIPSYAPVGRISFAQNDPTVYADFIRRLIGAPVDVSAGNWPYDDVLKNAGDTLTIQGSYFIYTSENNQEQFPADNLKKLDQKLRIWLKEKTGLKEVFVQDGLVQNGNTITTEYVRKYKNLPLFSQRISFTLVDGRLTRMEGSIKILYAIKASKSVDEIISPHIVLLTGKDKVQGIVESVELGYLSLQGDDLYDTPVWRVTLASGDVVWFNAYTGEFLENGSDTASKTSLLFTPPIDIVQ